MRETRVGKVHQTIPLSTDPQSGSAGRGTSTMPARIFIVGDEPRVAGDIALKLQQVGYAVVGSCVSGSEAQALIEHARPDLVLVDVLLPGGSDGIEVGDLLRRRFGVPVLYLTTRADECLLKRARITEPFEYILKPCSARELHITIAMALYQSDSEARLRDISIRLHDSAAWRDSEQRYRTLIETMSDGLACLDARNRMVYVNDSLCTMLGYGAEELLGHELTEFLDESDGCMFRDRPIAGGLGSPGAQDVELVTKAERRLPVHISVRSLHEVHGIPTGAIAVITDMSSRMEAEQQRLAQAQQQRDVLIREVHHRIKNNLQGVVSLLRQHITENPGMRNVVERVIAQVRSMAVVFGLQSSAHIDELRLCDMLTAICGMAGEVMNPRHLPVLDIDRPVPVCVSRAEAVPVALILNELIFNAIKHVAASDEAAGVTVSLRVRGDTARVLIRNRGVHLPASFDFATARGLGTGLLLVKSLLPHDGACLDISDEADGVSAELLLRSPVILSSEKQAR